MNALSRLERVRDLDGLHRVPDASVDKEAFLHLEFERRGERTTLVNLQRRAPLLVQQALYWDEEMPALPCVFMISTAGGVLQGDRLALEITLSVGAQAHVTTQAATKIHEMDANYATQTQTIVLADHAYLEYLPDIIIPHRHSRFISRTHVSIATSATLLYAEILMPGRKYYQEGERFAYDLFSSATSVQRPSGQELCADTYRVEPARQHVRQAGVMGAFDVFGNVLLLTPKAHADRIFKLVPAEFNGVQHWAAGASRLPNDAGLIYKIVGMESQSVRAKVREFWALVRREVVGAALPQPFLWR
jgi:urease accessory protein